MSWLVLSRRTVLLFVMCSIGLTLLGAFVAVISQDGWWLSTALLVVGVTTVVVCAKSISNQMELRLRPALQRDGAALLALERSLDVPPDVPLPGGWAAEPETLLTLISQVRAARANPVVVECGSGASTVWFALALRARGGGKVISLEHDPMYREQTRDAIASLGLSEFADVRFAPLIQLQRESRDVRWYDLAAVSDLGTIDILFVDGPPNHGSSDARGHAADILARHVSPDGVVVLDDVARRHERASVDRWVTGAGFEIDRRVGRAAVLRRAAGEPHSPAERSEVGERGQG